MKSLPEINPKLITNKIVGFLKSVQNKTGREKVVLGLSGGLDSTSTLYLLKKAYKPKNIFVVYMPYTLDLIPFFDKDLNLIKKLARDSRIPQENLYVVPLKKPADKIIDQMKTLGKKGLDKIICEIRDCFTCDSTDYLNKLRAGNMLARLRMITIFDIAKKVNGLVCGTENKSEKLLGYYTRFGDSASDIEPINSLYKTQVYQLAKYLKVPEEIIKKAPSAELWAGQTDEKEFGFTYEEADSVLYFYFDRKMSLYNISKLGYKKTKNIIGRFTSNTFKSEVPYEITGQKFLQSKKAHRP